MHRRLFVLITVIPFIASAAVAQTVIINEIHYAPLDKTVREEFVELHNPGGAPVDVSGWYFSDGIDYVFSPLTVIPPGGYLAVAQDPAVLRGLHGAGIAAVGPFAGRLASEGERVALRNPQGLLEDEVDYQDGFPWPTVGGDVNWSIELIHPTLDNDLGGSWRPSNPGLDASRTLVPDDSVWRYLKGTAEASSPVAAWRQRGFDDSSWLSGPAAIGYGETFIRTQLADMRGGYTTVFLRRTFTVDDPAAVRGLVLEVQHDDGFNAWINGAHVAGNNVSSQEMPFNGVAGSALEDFAFVPFPLPSPGGYLVAGVNVLAVQLHNQSLSGSSDAFIDLRLVDSAAAGAGPTPGARNSVFSANAPPQLRQVEHWPERPGSGDPVLITVKATDPDGVAAVVLEYQVVEPGSYIEIDDPEYELDWTALPMNDSGQSGDEIAGDGVFSAALPGFLQDHRRLMRYRIRATDGTGLAVRAPYPEDPQPNFAYFVYDGVPGWFGAIQPGSGDPARGLPVSYSPDDLSPGLPIYHLIAKRSAVEDATWNSRYGGSEYLWLGTLVYEGKVYDHIRYRARGGVWRYAMGKNMWKFDFLRGRSFAARDDFGRRYDTRWDKLNFSAVIQQGDYLHRGEQGLFESVGFKLFNLAGVEAPVTHFIHFRIIDEADELGGTQYGGDFWGLYLAVEQMDGRFLDEHRLPDGNLYKMESGTGELNNLGFDGPKDKSDLNLFLNTYSNTTPVDDWWRQNLDLDRYYNYRTIVEGIHHYDIAGGKNYFYYLDPETGRWSVLPWDIDLTWADNMFGSGNDPFKSRVLGRAAFGLEYRNRAREIRDLLYNTDQTYQLIDEMAAIVEGPPGGLGIIDADRAQWDYNPILANSSIVNLSKAGHGRFYQRAGSRDFRGMAGILKSYVTARGSWIDSNITADAAIPRRPAVTSIGPAGFPIDALAFRSSAFSDPGGDNTFGAMKWRLAEVTPPGEPPFSPTSPRRYEIEPAWESAELIRFASDVAIPASAARPGGRYRVRARMRDDTGRWSQWSAPVEFTAGQPLSPLPQQSSLRVTEVMYNPEEGQDLEFIEIQNIGPAPVDLAAVTIDGGIEFSFSEGAVPKLLPGDFVVVVKNRRAFEYRYGSAGIAIAGEYRGRLNNAGDRVFLAFGAGVEILDFAYDPAWYPPADGGGYSLVIADPLAPPAAWGQAAGWQPSLLKGGSPGTAESGAPSGGWQLPGDANQDQLLDIADAVSLLLHLFQGGARPLPCGGASIAEGGNRLLLDANGDGPADISDAVTILIYLFRHGPPPVLGTRCLRIEGCPSACRF